MGPSMFGMLLSCLGGLICFQLHLNFQINWNSQISYKIRYVGLFVLDYSLLLLNPWFIVEMQLASIRGHSKDTFAQDSQIFDPSSPLCVFKHPPSTPTFVLLFWLELPLSSSPPQFLYCEIQRNKKVIMSISVFD